MAITLHTDTVELPEQTELEVGRTRDEFQQAIDKDVEDLKMRTAKAGWPAHDPAKLFQRYVVGADDATALKSVIRRAAIMLKVEPAFYKVAKTEAGHLVIKFHVDRAVVLEDGKPKLENGKPVYKKDPTLDENGKPKAK